MLKIISILGVLVFFLTACEVQEEPSEFYDPSNPEYNPRAAEINVQLAVGYLQQGNIEVALSKIAKAMKQDPNLSSAFHTSALIQERLGDREQAERHYVKSISLDARYSEARNNYGQFLCKQERYDEADMQFAAALNNPLYGTPDVANSNAGLCRTRAGDYPGAEEYFRRALDANPLSPLALYQLAKLKYEAGNYLSSRAFLERYLSGRVPPNAQVLYLAYQNELAMGERKSALEYRSELLSKFPSSEEAKKIVMTSGTVKN